MSFLLNAKLSSGDHIPLMDHKLNPNVVGK